MDKYPIIGRYTNNIKKNEKKSDFFIRPLFKIESKEKDVLKAMQDNNLTVFIANACDGYEMERDSLIGNLGQSKTKYQLLSQSPNTNILNFSKNLLTLLISISEKAIAAKNSDKEFKKADRFKKGY